LPGPGSYRAPSDFGYFEMTKFNGGNFDYSFNMTSPKAKIVDNNMMGMNIDSKSNTFMNRRNTQ
jgi:hypothetical protein